MSAVVACEHGYTGEERDGCACDSCFAYQRVYEAIAASLREFGYGDVSAQMIRETDEARQNGAAPSEPHGIVSMFANRQLSEAEEKGQIA